MMTSSRLGFFHPTLIHENKFGINQIYEYTRVVGRTIGSGYGRVLDIFVEFLGQS